MPSAEHFPSTGTKDGSDVEEAMTAIYSAFLSFSRRLPHLSSGASSEKSCPVAVAWYSDGQREEIEEHMFGMLIHEHTWRKELLAIQAFVPHKRVCRGSYETLLHRLRRKAPAVLPQPSALAFNGLTQALAQFAERAFVDPEVVKQPASSGDGLVDSLFDETWPPGSEGMFFPNVAPSAFPSPSAAPATSAHHAPLAAGSPKRPGSVGDSASTTRPWAPRRLSVAMLEAEFVIDGGDTLWLTHCPAVRVRIDDAARRDLRDQQLLRWGRRATEEAEDAAVELTRALQAAEDGGAHIENVFLHFDREGSGKVDAEGLGTGLARLGLRVSDAAVRILAEQISSDGSGAFSAEDLFAFAHEDALDWRMLVPQHVAYGVGEDHASALSIASSSSSPFGGHAPLLHASQPQPTISPPLPANTPTVAETRGDPWPMPEESAAANPLRRLLDDQDVQEMERQRAAVLIRGEAAEFSALRGQEGGWHGMDA